MMNITCPACYDRVGISDSNSLVIIYLRTSMALINSAPWERRFGHSLVGYISDMDHDPLALVIHSFPLEAGFPLCLAPYVFRGCGGIVCWDLAAWDK